ncbi:efflux RND transporter periplasmic adaptor subunit [Photobacterium iliopiscarium]|jgi:RND family efflux transporter MFP subunit|uniref:Efflux RND transporter periplasmic adaptor subunit n=1 Tax=Photobacterium iliopiscarium TaxID=56192 RepID=A0A2T3MQD3_9GAMM|nr:efflux RND transporter periplasmic adaptor subunit [Photobacterium iliopiscarium]PSV99159.1 efflux RND transporter periplasmic adaptor subunit [Photobacterium iliopiscarium]
MLKRKLVSIWVITTVVLTLVGCDSRSNTSSIAPIVPAVQVETQPIKSRTIIQQVTGYGVVKSHNVVALKCLQTNKITAILFNAGQTVTKGQVLVQLDPQVAKAKVAHDQALLVATQQAWQRQARLSTKGLISRSVYDDSESSYKQALAQRNQDKSLLAQLTIKAPFTGVISLTDYHVGDVVTIGNTIATLYTPHQLKIEYQLPALHRQDYKLGQQVVVQSELMPSVKAIGRVTYIAPNTATGLVTLQAQLPPSASFSAGQYLKVVQQTQLLTHQVTIPTAALITNIDGAQAFVVINNKARLRNVKVGNYYDGYVQILSGLTVGEQLVVNGQNYLRTDQKVEIVHPQHAQTSIQSQVAQA